MLNRLFGFVVKKRIAVILAVVFVSCLAVFQMKNLYFENRMTQWIPEDDPVLKLLIHTGNVFGSNQLVVITIRAKDDEGFSRNMLIRLKDLTHELNGNEKIFLAVSLSNSPFVTKIEGGITVRDFLDEVPESRPELIRLKETALSKDSYVNNVISGDGEWLAVSVYIEPREDLIGVFRKTVKPAVEKHFQEQTEIYYSGIPSDAYFADKYVSSDMKILIPLIVVIILGLLYFSFRHWKGVLFPFFVVAAAVLWTFGVMGLVRSPLNMITPALPVLLIALGSAYGIHVVNTLYSEPSGAPPAFFGVRSAAGRIAVPVILAGLTTVAGFISFLTVKLNIIAEFGLFSALGIVFAVFISLVFIPAGHVLFKGGEKTARRRHMSFLVPFLESLFRFVEKRKKIILVLSVFIFFGMGYGLFMIKRQVNFSEYFPKNSEPRNALDVVKNHFGGSFPLTVYMKGESVKSAAFLRLVRRVSLYLDSIHGTGRPYSAADFIQELNEHLNNRYHIPDSDAGVGNLWFFLEGRAEIKQIVSDDLRECLVFSRVSNSEIDLMRRLRRSIDDFIQNEYGNGISVYNLNNIGQKKEQELRRKEAEYILDEIGWLVQSHEGASFDKKSAAKAFDSLLKNFPEPGHEDVKKTASQVLRDYIFADYFDFLISKDKKNLLHERLVETLSKSKGSVSDIQGILKEVIPRRLYDEMIAFDAASALSFRVTESIRFVFSERACRKIYPLITFPSPVNSGFEKKLKGLFYETADDMVLLPGKNSRYQGHLLSLMRIEQSGHPVFMTRIDHFLYTSQLQSLIIALVITFILITLMSRSLKWGCISILPIGFTLHIIYSFLGLAGIPLDFATMMIAGVCIGVGIDYVIHFTHGIRETSKQEPGLEDSLKRVFMEKGKAILANSLAVMSGFLVLLFSSMTPLRNFGGVMAGAMFLAALSTLTILPAFILIFKPKIGGKHE